MAKRRLLKPNYLVFVPILIVLLVALACGDDATPTPTATTPPTAVPATATPLPTATVEAVMEKDAGLLTSPQANAKYGGTLRLGGLSRTAHFDLHQCGTLACLFPLGPLYDNLVRFSPFEPGMSVTIPDLATSWKVSNDTLTYTFQLRKGVKWHDGTDFSADDVKATFDRISFPPENVISVRGSLFEVVKEINIIDPLTVEFVLKEPSGLFLSALSLSWNPVYQKKALVDNDFDLKRVRGGSPGTGPYKFVKYETGEVWEFDKNENYWNPELPYVDGLQNRVIVRGPPTGAAFIAGQLDFAEGVGGPDVQEKLKALPNATFNEFKHPSFQGIWVNFERKPFDDVRVRKAIKLALNKVALSEAIVAVKVSTEVGWLTAADPRFDAYWAKAVKEPGWRVPTADDLAEAKKLMADAGFADGMKDVDFVVRDNSWMRAMSPVIQALLKQNLNMDVTIRKLSGGIIFEEMQRGNYDIGLNATSMTLSLLADYWGLVFKTDGPQNWGGYSNPEFDAVYRNILQESDEAKMVQHIEDGLKILDKDVPVIIINTSKPSQAWYNYLKGHNLAVRTSVYDPLRWQSIWLDK